MAHKLFLNADVKDLEVGSKDVMFLVYSDGKKFGELRVSKGAVVWRGRSDKFGRKLRWQTFDRMMQEHGYLQEERKPREKKSVSRAKRTRY